MSNRNPLSAVRCSSLLQSMMTFTGRQCSSYRSCDPFHILSRRLFATVGTIFRDLLPQAVQSSFSTMGGHRYLSVSNSAAILVLSLLNSLMISQSLKPVAGPVKVGSLVMSPIGCGTWAWGNRFLWGYEEKEDESLKQAFDFVVSKGVTWFDTADSYGTGKLSGRSEELLGQFVAQIKSKDVTKKVNFITKLAPYPWRIGEESMIEASKASILRLGRPIDMVQLHWPPSLGWQEKEYLNAFNRLVRDGKATQIGVSNYGPKTLRAAAAVVEKGGGKIFTNQVQFSLLSRYPITSGLTDVCEELGIRPISYSPLALGLLTDKYTIDNLPKGPRSILFREFLPIMKPLLDELRDIARQRKKTVSQVALNWNLQKGFLVLVGIRTVDQAKENLGAQGWSLTPAEVECLEIAAKKVPKQLIQNSFQTD